MKRLKITLALTLVVAFLFTSTFSQTSIVLAKDNNETPPMDNSVKYSSNNIISNDISITTPGAINLKFKNNERKQILVKYMDDNKAEIVKNRIKGKLLLSKMKVKKKSKNTKIETVELSADDDIDNVIKELNNDPDVLYAQRDNQIYFSSNDPYFNNQWRSYRL
jgi:hypothetical protein